MIERRNRRSSLLFPLLLCLALVSAGLGAFPLRTSQAWAQQAPLTQASGVAYTIQTLVVVNDEAITNVDLDARIRFVALTTNRPYTDALRQELYQTALDALIDESLQLQEAKKGGVEIADSEVMSFVTNMAQQNKQSAEQFLGGLRANGVDPATFMRQIRARSAWQKLIVKRLPGSQIIDRDELAAEIEAEKAKAGQVERDVYQIYLPYAGQAPEQVMAQAQALMQAMAARQLRFTEAAKQYSQGPAAPQGGSLGWLTDADLPAVIADAVRKLDASGISQPVQGPDGIYLVAVRDQRTIGQKQGRSIFDLKQLFLRLPANQGSLEGQQKLALAQRVIQSVKGCAAFNEAMISAGDQGSGDLNGIDLATLPEQVAAILTQLPIGQPSPVLPVPNGASIFMVCNKRNEIESVEEGEIRSRLIAAKAERYAERLLRELRRQAFIEYKG